MVFLWIGAGFAAFGALVGITAGLSSAALTTTLLGLLFALIGGSIGVFLGKIDAEARKLTGIALLAFSVLAIVGLFSGIYVRINDLLRITPRIQTVATAAPGTAAAALDAKAATERIAAGSDYLKSHALPLEIHLTREVSNEKMTLASACAELKEQAEYDAKRPH